MAYTQLIPQQTSDASIDEISPEGSHFLLSIAAGKSSQYRLAQLDDYAKIPRGAFPHRPPVRLGLSARASSDSIPGTWGFGFWNYPFGMSLGFGGTAWRLPTLPNAVWFFGASKENFLSFREDTRPERSEAQSKGKPQSNSPSSNRTSTGTSSSPTGAADSAHPSSQGGIAANGFLAQSFRSPVFHPLLIPAGLALPFSRKMTRRMLSKVIVEDGVQLKVDPTQWHKYRIDWSEKRVALHVDDTLVFQSQVSPKPPLGLVIWIDNQYAAFTPEGKIGFGVLENPEPAWLEVKDIDIA